MELRSTTLSDSLGFKGDGRHYYIFRDYARGLEYIRNGRELCEQGMFVEMEAYEYHAFLDFREIWDDEYGTWGRLCHQLEGRPVLSIDDEVKQFRFAGLINLLRDLLDSHGGLLTEAFAEIDAKSLAKVRLEFEDDLATFFDALAEQAALTVDTKPIIDMVKKELAWLEGHLAKVEASISPPGYTSRLLAFAWLCLHRIGELEEDDEPAAATTELVEKYGLARPFQEELYAEGGGEDDPLSALDVPSIILLLSAMLHWQELLALPTDEQEDWLQDLLSDKVVAAFIGRHKSGGFDWFIKERWELLIQFLTLTSLMNEAGASSSGNIAPARLKALRKAEKSLIDRAGAAGYKVEQFLEME
jgi:hypothetical protein